MFVGLLWWCWCDVWCMKYPPSVLPAVLCCCWCMPRYSTVLSIYYSLTVSLLLKVIVSCIICHHDDWRDLVKAADCRRPIVWWWWFLCYNYYYCVDWVLYCVYCSTPRYRVNLSKRWTITTRHKSTIGMDVKPGLSARWRLVRNKTKNTTTSYFFFLYFTLFVSLTLLLFFLFLRYHSSRFVCVFSC